MYLRLNNNEIDQEIEAYFATVARSKMSVTGIIEKRQKNV